MASSPPLSHTEAICQAFNSCCCQTPESVCLSTCLVPSLHIHGCFCPISTSCIHEAACTQPPPLSFRTLSTCTDSLKQSPQRGPFGLTSLSFSLFTKPPPQPDVPAVGAFCLCLDPRRPRPFPDLLAVAPPLHSQTRCLATRVSPRLRLSVSSRWGLCLILQMTQA